MSDKYLKSIKMYRCLGFINIKVYNKKKKNAHKIYNFII